MSGEDKSLMERIEMPSVPQDARAKLALVEEELARAGLEQMRKSVLRYAPIYKKREEVISLPSVKPDFWARVFSSAPPEIDEYVLDDDAAILGGPLKNVTVERFEVDAEGNGEPRSVRFTFEFDPEENDYFDNAKLVKEFYWRKQIIKTSSGKRRVWEGLVSDPVRINWKEGQDTTNGLLDAACDLFDAEKKGGDRKKLPEYEALVKKLELLEAEQMNDDDEDVEMPEDDDDESHAGVSFFAFFGYRGRDISAEQNKEAVKEDEERFVKMSKGEEVDEDEDDEDDEDEDLELLVDDLEDAEIFSDGEELAIALAEDLWLNALKYYAQSFQPNFDFEGLDMEELEGMDEDEEEGENAPPAKKARN
ncbi:uncharacterized protein N7473_003536 [Penicillium subrubescens]|jgi:hypothetical protein|uniref:Nucleosome assembly protein C36B7.08c n=1 Tax=Penicillium subrubescens TaxID=1316194 RepID=A0A1Q5THV5_9EURO|nr:uncharacterized protein N7473_003536 [Penicillium subrubescens]KAJ5906620.1 hypothetical protein N7473_003536 [Penicillium subrubescens]OKO99808.1 hypothetical protein PENSUB_8025 [Penicillium subrubescens]